MRQTRRERQNAALPPELAAHPDNSAAYEDWRAWRQRRRTWFTEHRLSYNFSEDLRLRRSVRHSGGNWTQAEPGRSAWTPRDLRERDLPSCGAGQGLVANGDHDSVVAGGRDGPDDPTAPDTPGS